MHRAFCEDLGSNILVLFILGTSDSMQWSVHNYTWLEFISTFISSLIYSNLQHSRHYSSNITALETYSALH